MLSSTSPGTKGFTTTARRHRSKAPTESVLMHGRPGTFACLAGGVAPEPSSPNAAGAKPPDCRRRRPQEKEDCGAGG